MTGSVIFDPLLPWPVIAVLGGALLAALALAMWRGLAGWPLRLLAGLVILGALSGPLYRQEDRAPLSDIVLLAVDESASQGLGDRTQMTQDAADTIAARLKARGNTEVRRVIIPDGADNAGTQAMTAISGALAEEPQNRVAGVILLSDGRVHDMDRAPDLPAPMHLLKTGHASDWDRRLEVRNAPAFGILGEEIKLTLRVSDAGAAPAKAGPVRMDIAVDGGAPRRFQVPLGKDVTVPLKLPHGGRNVLQFTTPEVDGELTARNNTALVQINGVRDRLRVLLVSGEPHAGTRTWRNLLKSDPSVDLVHFTILRPPEKQDGVPVRELSLIAFPTRELFLEKIDDFDLIIFDRYKRRGILPGIYLDNVRNYVEQGGAVLFAAGPDFASADSLYRTPLAPIIPAQPTARVVTQAFRPTVTNLGKRHPVTAGLKAEAGGKWGRWLRQVEVTQTGGEEVMSGADGGPLLVLDRIGKGRVALLASDQAWLWSRGYEGGGPQLDLLRRLAHWMMKEPELEEESLWADAAGQKMRIIRQSVKGDVGPVRVTTPSGKTVTLDLTQVHPGRYEAQYDGPEIGLYRLENGDQKEVIGLGPSSPVEFERTIATGNVLQPAVAASNGGVVALENGVPRIREVRQGRPAAGRGWIGITPRGAYRTLSLRKRPLLPAWAVLLVASALILGGWLREGRRG